MYGKVMIGSKEVEMLANAATPYRYQIIFKEDFFKKVSGKEETDSRDFFAKLGYTMAKQAEKGDMSKLNTDTFLMWLEAFEPADVFAATSDIADIYNGMKVTSVDPKDESGQPSDQ